jgi:hypothetical protein
MRVDLLRLRDIRLALRRPSEFLESQTAAVKRRGMLRIDAQGGLVVGKGSFVIAPAVWSVK